MQQILLDIDRKYLQTLQAKSLQCLCLHFMVNLWSSKNYKGHIGAVNHDFFFHILYLIFVFFPHSAILEKLLTQENRVLEYWTTKKKRLDQTQQFCLFERSARQSLAWIKEEGDIYLSTHTR